MLAIMMVAVLSFSFASCDKDKDDDNATAKGTYTLSSQVVQGTLTDDQYRDLNQLMGNALQGSEFEDMTLDEVVNNVNTRIGSMAPQIVEAYPGKTFTVNLFIKDASGNTVKTIAVEVENGQIKQ